MSRLSLALLVICLILPVNSRAFDTVISSESDSNEDAKAFDVLPKSVLTLRSGDEDSPKPFVLGQVGGLAASIQSPNRLVIFHRGSREWTAQSFPDGINFDTNKFSAISENTIVSIDTRSGQMIDQWGNKTFSMPHGLSMDSEGSLWLTDVAMHQVFKYSPQGKQLLALGEAFVPGKDSKHFCKPTDVILSNDRSRIFVADGYCNSRVVKLDGQGNFLSAYTMDAAEKQMSIPHSLLLIESLDLLCVADRENGRIVCFDSGLDDEQTEDNDEGQVKAIIEHPLMKSVYAIAYDANKHRLFAVSGGSQGAKALGFTFSAESQSFGELLATWKPHDNFGEPHDLALSVNGRALFVGEIRPNRIDTFDVLN